MSYMAQQEDYIQRLHSAETEEEVEEIIEQFADEFDIEWVPVGGQENNSGLVDIQKGTPVGALAEIIVNGFDAILQKRYLQKHGEEYNDEHGLDTYLKAAEELLEEGHDEFVEIIADGQKAGRDQSGMMNLTVADTGKGQGYSDFTNFVNLMEVGLNKQQWPFSQGQFGMGSQASLRYCGDDELNGKGYKLISSAHFESPREWTWSLIRRKPNQPTTFEYLTIGGDDFPVFEGELNDQENGTLIKHFNYQLEKKSGITNHTALLGELNLELIENPVPIKLNETRYYSESRPDSFFQTETMGALKQLQNDDTVKGHYETHLESRSMPEWLQGISTHAFLFHSNQELEEMGYSDPIRAKRRLMGGSATHEDNAIIFAANGERHASMSLYHIRNNCDLYNTAKDVLVIVDLSQLSGIELREIFDPSRDNFQNSDTSKKLREQVIKAIKNIEPLREEEARRRTETTEEETHEQVAEEMADMLDQNPDLAEWLNIGDLLPDAQAEGETVEFEYNENTQPTELQVVQTYRPRGNSTVWNNDEPMSVGVPVNKTRWVRFKLDAPNGYFDETRGEFNGELRFRPDNFSKEMIESWGLNNGILSVSVETVDGQMPEMELPITVEVERDDGEVLTENIVIVIEEEAPERKRDRVTDDEEAEDNQNGEFGVPDIDSAGLDSPYFNSEEEIVMIREPSDGALMVRVNKDARVFQDFLASRNFRSQAPDYLLQKYTLGVGFYTFGQYHQIRKGGNKEEHEAVDIVCESAKGFAPIFFAIHFSDDELDSLTA